MLTSPNGNDWAIEIKRSLSRKIEKGFHIASGDPRPERRFVVYPGTERHKLARMGRR